MGTINKGILGGFSGTVGTVIGGSWKGIDYMRSMPVRRSGSLTEGQANQQIKFALAIRFIQTIGSLVMISFRNYAVKMTGRNSAVAYVLKHAITGSAPDFAIDFSLVLISRGDLPNALNPTALAISGNKVKFSWENNAGVGKSRPTDKALLVVHCPFMNMSIYTTGSAERSILTETLNAATFSGHKVETYVGFISEDGKEIATSTYTGSLTIA